MASTTINESGKHFLGLFFSIIDSVEADQSMDAGDDMGAVDMVPTLMSESNNNSKAKALINIAEAKGLSSVIVDNDYDAWERFQNMKMVSKTARVNKREKKERIQKEISDPVDKQENEERSIYNQVTLLTEVVHNLLNTRSEKVNQNTKDSKTGRIQKTSTRVMLLLRPPTPQRPPPKRNAAL